MHDDQFTAIGPFFRTHRKQKTAFSTEAPKEFEYGVNVRGKRCGVFGESGTTNGDSSLSEGVGVQGSGSTIGVFGHGGHGIAGVYGHANHSQAGVLGAAMRDGNGVVGISLNSLGNPAATFESVPPTKIDGSGIGVIGASGEGSGVVGISTTGQAGEFTSQSGAGVMASSREGRGGEFSSETRAGVRGTSSDGNGGEFRSTNGEGVSAKSAVGVAVHGVSRGERGGVFESGKNVAQINLVPLMQTTQTPKLPKDGTVGDLLLIQNVVAISGPVVSDTCSLWLCVPSRGRIASWREVQLGNPVKGTL
jgi:hypothetical protein